MSDNELQIHKLGIVGLGYVGLPLAIRCVEAGFEVVGFDIDQQKIDRIQRGESYLKHIGENSIRNAIDSGLTVSSDYAEVESLDAIIICVPTPLSLQREPDLSYVRNTISSLSPYFKAGQILSLESTTYPGTTEEILRPAIEERGFRLGEDFFLVYSPEREDPGNEKYTTRSIPKVVGGTTPSCLEKGVMLYQRIVDQVVPVSSTGTAEMTKLLENIHRAVNISLVNEMKMVADKFGIDIHEVIRAASTKPFGFVPYYPGPGLGGHCIPVDPFYLTWKAREFGISTRFIELAGEVDAGMPGWVVSKVSDALNNHGKPLKDSRILILGAAYKKNVDDMRESPALAIIDLLSNKGAVLDYSDPWVPYIKPTRKYAISMKSTEISSVSIAKYDLVLIVTDHDEFDYDAIVDAAKLIVDTRGVYSEKRGNVVRA